MFQNPWVGLAGKIQQEVACTLLQPFEPEEYLEAIRQIPMQKYPLLAFQSFLQPPLYLGLTYHRIHEVGHF